MHLRTTTKALQSVDPKFIGQPNLYLSSTQETPLGYCLHAILCQKTGIFEVDGHFWDHGLGKTLEASDLLSVDNF